MGLTNDITPGQVISKYADCPFAGPCKKESFMMTLGGKPQKFINQGGKFTLVILKVNATIIV